MKWREIWCLTNFSTLCVWIVRCLIVHVIQFLYITYTRMYVCLFAYVRCKWRKEESRLRWMSVCTNIISSSTKCLQSSSYAHPRRLSFSFFLSLSLSLSVRGCIHVCECSCQHWQTVFMHILFSIYYIVYTRVYMFVYTKIDVRTSGGEFSYYWRVFVHWPIASIVN